MLWPLSICILCLSWSSNLKSIHVYLMNGISLYDYTASYLSLLWLIDLDPSFLLSWTVLQYSCLLTEEILLFSASYHGFPAICLPFVWGPERNDVVFFFWPYPLHMEVPVPGIESESQLWPMLQLQQHQIVYPLCWARDWTHTTAETAQDPLPTVPSGNSMMPFSTSCFSHQIRS